MGLYNFVIELLCEAVFPVRCVHCKRYGAWWCEDCMASAEVVYRDACSSCASLKREHECVGPSNGLDGLIVAGFYHDPRLRAVIHALKYKGATRILPSLRPFCRAWSEARLDPWPWAGLPDLAIQPVPGAPGRIRARGFDQADLIADVFRETCVPWARPLNILERHDSPQPQVSLDPGPLRAANVTGAFSVIPGAVVPPSILLVDDVLTTGSTMREAASELREAGAQKVFGFALAVGK